MSNENTKVTISVDGNVFEFCGAEAFVQRQIDEFKEVIVHKVKDKQAVKPPKKTGVKTQEKLKVSNEMGEQPYPNVIEFNDEEINILKNGEGGNAAKVTNIAYIYLWAKAYKDGKCNEVPSQEIIGQCKTHGCFDGNYASALKKIDRKYVGLKGAGKSITIRLTVPGKKKAEEIIKTLHDEG